MVGPAFSLTHGFDNSSPPSFSRHWSNMRPLKITGVCLSMWLHCPLVLTLRGEVLMLLQLRANPVHLADRGSQIHY